MNPYWQISARLISGKLIQNRALSPKNNSKRILRHDNERFLENSFRPFLKISKIGLAHDPENWNFKKKIWRRFPGLGGLGAKGG